MHGPMSDVASRPSPTRSDFARVTNREINSLYTPLVHRHAARRRAALPGGAESAPDRAIHRQIQIGIIHHDDDVFPAHFQAAMLEIRRARLRDNPAHRR